MKNKIRNIDPDLPAEIGNNLPVLPEGQEFLIPENYFGELERHIMGSIRLRELKGDDDFVVDKKYFGEMENQLLSRIRMERMLSSSVNEEFRVPIGYFESAERRKPLQATGKLIDAKSRFQWAALWIPAAVAASILLVWLFKPLTGSEETFASMLEATELSAADVEYYADSEDLYALYIEEVEEMLADTIEPTTPVNPAQVSLTKVDSTLKTNPREKPAKAKSPAKKEKQVSFDELTEDEIMDYLLDEGADNLFDDL